MERRLLDFDTVLRTCVKLDIPIFYMKDVIKTMKKGNMEYEKVLKPLSTSDIDLQIKDRDYHLDKYHNHVKKPSLFRLNRMIQFIQENDPIKKTSLVRSIGQIPLKLAKIFPNNFVSRNLLDSYNALILDNAKIKNLD